MPETLVVRREQHIAAPPAAVFALLTDPRRRSCAGWEHRRRPSRSPAGFISPMSTGARVARGSLREVVPVHRLAYTFGWDGSEEVPPGSSLVEIDLIEQPDGTLLRLTHSGCRMPSNAPAMRKAGPDYLGRLATVAAGRDPGPDPWHGRTGGK